MAGSKSTPGTSRGRDDLGMTRRHPECRANAGPGLTPPGRSVLSLALTLIPLLSLSPATLGAHPPTDQDLFPASLDPVVKLEAQGQWTSNTLAKRAVPAKGPCLGPAVTIRVSSAKDLQQRTQYPSSQTVRLELQKSLILPGGLLLNSSWACTIVTAPAHTTPANAPSLYFSSSKQPAIAIVNTSNVLFTKVNIKSAITTTSRPCSQNFPAFREAQDTGGVTCPAVFVYGSFGVQVTQATVYGRIDVFRSAFVKLDSLAVSMPRGSYDPTLRYTDRLTRGVIRVGLASTGYQLRSSHTLVSNCEVHGHWELISLYRGAVGVTVRNNHLHNFEFTAVRCGAGDEYIMDCHLNTVAYNLIQNSKDFAASKSDAANSGIYAYTRWFNPGNQIVCNYIENQRTCINLDYASSGVMVVGGVCAYSGTALSVNNGKYNRVMYLVAAYTKDFLSSVSCSRAQSLNYFSSKVVRNWEAVRRKYYNTGTLSRFRWFPRLCNPILTKVGGQVCNPAGKGLSGQATGQCTGLPLGNVIELFGYKNGPGSQAAVYSTCGNVPSTAKINVNRWINASGKRYEANFYNPQPSSLDFGVNSTSPVYQFRPRFRNCPRSASGPQPVDWKTYYRDFNIAKPLFFGSLLTFPESKMKDTSAPK